jgi:Ca2+-binding EF-hand superfamily protein
MTYSGIESDAQKILTLVQAHSQGEEIDFEGFLEIFGFSADNKAETTLQSLFEEFDKEGKGHFSEVEFGRVCDLLGERFSDNELLTMIQYGDKDKDGVINYNDFVDVVTKEYPKV